MKQTIDVPFIAQTATQINEYLAYINTDPGDRDPRSENDEQSLIFMLTGLGGLIEYNLRAGYQKFARKNSLDKDKFYNYGDLVDAISPYIQKVEGQRLLKISSQIRNKLVHSDFPALYNKTKEAYEIDNAGLQQQKFEPVVHLIQTTITKHGLHLDVSSATAKDSRGNTIPTKRLLPGEGNSITIDFSYFYESGHFIHVYDVLITCYKAFVLFRYDDA